MHKYIQTSKKERRYLVVNMFQVQTQIGVLKSAFGHFATFNPAAMEMIILKIKADPEMWTQIADKSNQFCEKYFQCESAETENEQEEATPSQLMLEQAMR